MRNILFICTVLLSTYATTCFAASPDGTTIPSATQIIDATGAFWLVQGGGVTCTRNGISPNGCSNVLVLLYYNGNVYAEVYAENSTSDHNWYQFSNTSLTWAKVSGDPRPIPSPPPVAASPNGTTIPSATQIIDSTGAFWLVQAGGVTCTRNGFNPDGCGNVLVLLYYNGNVYAENSTSDHNWYQFSNKSLTWVKVSGDPRSSPTPPVQPQPAPVPDVTAFYPTNGSKIYVDGHRFGVENANKSYSISNPDSQTLVFQVQSGDHWDVDASIRPTLTPERSEIDGASNMYASGTPIQVSYNFAMGVGAANTSSGITVGQFHSNDCCSSPPFEIALQPGEKMTIYLGWLTANPSPLPTLLTHPDGDSYGIAYRDSNDIVRGHVYAMVIKVKFHPTNGYAYVYRDGVQIVNYTGPLGFGGSTYWKNGIYRSHTTNDTQRAMYKDLVTIP